jgi:hypothetical protein
VRSLTQHTKQDCRTPSPLTSELSSALSTRRAAYHPSLASFLVTNEKILLLVGVQLRPADLNMLLVEEGVNSGVDLDFGDDYRLVGGRPRLDSGISIEAACKIQIGVQCCR